MKGNKRERAEVRGNLTARVSETQSAQSRVHPTACFHLFTRGGEPMFPAFFSSKYVELITTLSRPCCPCNKFMLWLNIHSSNPNAFVQENIRDHFLAEASCNLPETF